MRVITLHIEESPDAMSLFGPVADALQALAEQGFGNDPRARAYVENLAERARMTENLYQYGRKEGLVK
jgi:hypothetical protein